MSALNKESRVNLRESQERFAEDFLLFQGGASTNDEEITNRRARTNDEEITHRRLHVVAEHEPLEMSAVRLARDGADV